MSFTKTCRKLCCFIAFVLAFCFLVGCTVTPGTPSEREINKKAAEEAVSEITKGILWDPTSMNAITSASLSLPTTTKYDNVVISWESSEEDVIASVESAEELARLSGLPIKMTTVSEDLINSFNGEIDNIFPLKLQKKIV